MEKNAGILNVVYRGHLERLITLGRKTNQQTRKKMKYCQMDIGGWHTIISTIV